MDKFDRENGVKSCEKWHELSPETGVRVTTSTVILHQYKGHGYAGEAKKQLFDNLKRLSQMLWPIMSVQTRLKKSL